MKNTKLTILECEAKAKFLIANGQSIVIINDNDDIAYQNGWADYLSKNYNYSNLNLAFRVNLEKPKSANGKVEITPNHIDAIRNKYPNAKDMNDEQIIDSILQWEKQFDETGKSRSLISALAFPSFDEYLHFKKPGVTDANKQARGAAA